MQYIQDICMHVCILYSICSIHIYAVYMQCKYCIWDSILYIVEYIYSILYY